MRGRGRPCIYSCGGAVRGRPGRASAALGCPRRASASPCRRRDSRYRLQGPARVPPSAPHPSAPRRLASRHSRQNDKAGPASPHPPPAPTAVRRLAAPRQRGKRSRQAAPGRRTAALCRSGRTQAAGRRARDRTRSADRADIVQTASDRMHQNVRRGPARPYRRPRAGVPATTPHFAVPARLRRRAGPCTCRTADQSSP